MDRCKSRLTALTLNYLKYRGSRGHSKKSTNRYSPGRGGKETNRELQDRGTPLAGPGTGLWIGPVTSTRGTPYPRKGPRTRGHGYPPPPPPPKKSWSRRPGGTQTPVKTLPSVILRMCAVKIKFYCEHFLLSYVFEFNYKLHLLQIQSFQVLQSDPSWSGPSRWSPLSHCIIGTQRRTD